MPSSGMLGGKKKEGEKNRKKRKGGRKLRKKKRREKEFGKNSKPEKSWGEKSKENIYGIGLKGIYKKSRV
jgi:hypothetical protein